MAALAPMPDSWHPRRADSKSRILRRPIGVLRPALGAALSHPFYEQHVADGLLGLFVGPVVLAVGYVLLIEWMQTRRAQSGPPTADRTP